MVGTHEEFKHAVRSKIADLEKSKYSVKRPRSIESSVDWSYYNDPNFKELEDKYLPSQGEGETKATQAVCAVCKLVYKWYNDGDVYDTQNLYLDPGGNDLSSYANWLYRYIPEVQYILDGIWRCNDSSDYEDVLQDLADYIFDPIFLEDLNKERKVGSVYDRNGSHFIWEEYEEEYDEDDEDWYY